MNDEIRLGQWWMVRLSKCDVCVRLESYHPDGGWIARVMLHGRKVRIKSAAQLLRRCNKAEIVATNPSCRLQKEPTLRKPLSLLDATAVVLLESKIALSAREIITLVVERQLWKSTGATPWATLNSALHRDLQVNGMASRFEKTGRGLFALR